jgi:hypothetical protein
MRLYHRHYGFYSPPAKKAQSKPGMTPPQAHRWIGFAVILVAVTNLLFLVGVPAGGAFTIALLLGFLFVAAAKSAPTSTAKKAGK